LSVVVPSAFFGRVASLFIPRGVRVWGTYDVADHTVHLHERKQAGDQDLIGLAAKVADLHGADVFAVQAGEIPGGGCIAAVIREGAKSSSSAYGNSGPASKLQRRSGRYR
jgi:hypothetical protein